MLRMLFCVIFIPMLVTAGTLPHPTVFVANEGQWPSKVLYGARSENVNVWITRSGLVLDQQGVDASGTRGHHAVTFDVLGSSRSASVEASSATDAPKIYFQRSGLKSGMPLPTASAVIVRNVRPGVHLEYVWEGENVRYNVLVDPGVQLPSPLFSVSGANSISTTHDGFDCKTTLGTVSMSGLAAYSVTPDHGRSVMPIARGSEIGFVVSDRISSEALTVDPIVSARAIHGSGDQEITTMALDKTGRVVVGGWTSSFDIAIPSGGATTSGAAGIDGFVACLTPDLKTIIAWTYIAGDSNEVVRSLAVSPLGDIWVTGETNSKNLPVSVPKGGKYAGKIDGFVLRYSADLARVLAGKYIAGNDEDRPHGIACNSAGDVFICGQTRSTSGIGNTIGYDQTQNGGWDGFVLKIERTGADVENFTYFGSPGNDAFTTVAVDNSGNAVVGGWTSSNEFVTFPIKTRVWVVDPMDYYYGGHWEDQGSNAYDPEFNGGTSDAVIAKFTSDGLLSFSTYFGGGGEDRASRVITDNEGRIMVVGTTRSSNLPVPEGGVSVYNGKQDAFAFGLSADGLRLRSCMYFGGDGDDNATDATFDAQYNVIITGSTTSNNIAQLGAGTTSARAGEEDGFLTVLSASETLYSTLFGWSGSDVPRALTRDALGDCFIAGRTSSSFPGNTVGGAHDGFIAKWAFGTLVMRSPLAGTLICTGTQVPISWVTEEMSPTSTYEVGYSTDEGETWTVAARGIKQKSYTWTVPAERPTSGRIMVRVSSVNGHIAMGASPYTIESAPLFTQQPQSGTYCPGTRIELAPEVDGGNVAYQWRKNGVNIAGATQRVFVIGSASNGDAGAYDVVATTACKVTTSAAAAIGISAQPAISTQPMSANVQPGAQVVLYVSAVGQALTYQWEFNGTSIPNATMDTLVISAITKEQQGAYRCVVGSACGSTTSSEATINVSTVSIDEELAENTMLVSPQPAHESVRVTTPRALSANAIIRFYNVNGVEVGNLAQVTSTSSSTFTISLRNLPIGAYTLVVTDGSVTFRQVVVVAR